ncbi:hypothetical protein COY62_00745 [bacterium (Candidatus Howlettbacteria) CG_4_10_14_0_8_um_filter_40_9]|nr:MAG: hypothetical protein COY62_00745 [bacterium (Candidatus Howlettbacteria) CG_4_10_14_0_8_um_filter_40_9]
MNKKIIIIILSLSVLVSFFFVFSYLNKGVLVLKINTQNNEVVIDKQKIKGNNSFTRRVSPGQHRLIVSKEGYEEFNEDITIKRGSTLQKNIKLEKTDSVLIGLSEGFINELNTLPAKNPDSYLNDLEAMSTKEYFPYLKDNIASPNPGKKTGYSKVKIIETKIKSKEAGQADMSLVADIESLNPKISNTPSTIRFAYDIQLKKENSKWLVNWVITDIAG